MTSPEVTSLRTSIVEEMAIVEEWTKLSQSFINKSIDEWRRRLDCVVQQNGGHIEHMFV